VAVKITPQQLTLYTSISRNAKTCGSRLYKAAGNRDSNGPEAKPRQEVWGQSSPKAEAVFVSADMNFSVLRKKNQL